MQVSAFPTHLVLQALNECLGGMNLLPTIMKKHCGGREDGYKKDSR